MQRAALAHHAHRSARIAGATTTGQVWCTEGAWLLAEPDLASRGEQEAEEDVIDEEQGGLTEAAHAAGDPPASDHRTSSPTDAHTAATRAGKTTYTDALAHAAAENNCSAGQGSSTSADGVNSQGCADLQAPEAAASPWRSSGRSADADRTSDGSITHRLSAGQRMSGAARAAARKRSHAQSGSSQSSIQCVDLGSHRLKGVQGELHLVQCMWGPQGCRVVRARSQQAPLTPAASRTYSLSCSHSSHMHSEVLE